MRRNQKSKFNWWNIYRKISQSSCQRNLPRCSNKRKRIPPLIDGVNFLFRFRVFLLFRVFISQRLFSFTTTHRNKWDERGGWRDTGASETLFAYLRDLLLMLTLVSPIPEMPRNLKIRSKGYFPLQQEGCCGSITFKNQNVGNHQARALGISYRVNISLLVYN